MRRKLFSLATVISLVLCLAVAWVWRYPRSTNGVQHAIVEFPVGGRVVQLSEVSGRLFLGWLPGEHRQLAAQKPPAGLSNRLSVWGIPDVGGRG